MRVFPILTESVCILRVNQRNNEAAGHIAIYIIDPRCFVFPPIYRAYCTNLGPYTELVKLRYC